MTKKKSTRGGRREGAGRKKLPEEKKTRVMRVPNHLVGHVKELINKSKQQ